MARPRRRGRHRPPGKDAPAKKDAPASDADSTAAGAAGKIKPGMSEQQIRDAGLAIDVPFESGESAPERLQYADLGKTWTPPDGWPPEIGTADSGEGEPS